ncbi:hypothetical protein Tco_0261185 [Tanacetum coccineum]
MLAIKETTKILGPDQAENEAASRIDKRATLFEAKIAIDFKVGIGVMLKVSPGKGLCDLELNFLSKRIHVDDKLQFVEEPVEIMEREIKRLKRSQIPLVKVRWNSRRGPEFTWERKDSFKQKYP